jgi:hypothetical protein
VDNSGIGGGLGGNGGGLGGFGGTAAGIGATGTQSGNGRSGRQKGFLSGLLSLLPRQDAATGNLPIATTTAAPLIPFASGPAKNITGPAGKKGRKEKKGKHVKHVKKGKKAKNVLVPEV